MIPLLERTFQLSHNGTTVRTELIAGLTTFLTMAYIVVVNPAILADAGMDRGAVFVATCLAAALGSLAMGLYANYPIALAPGMGLNAYFTYTVVGQMGHSWQAALGAVFLSGVLFLLLSLSPARDWVVNAVPRTLKLAISAGIGLFLALIALKNAGIIAAHPATYLTTGDLTRPGPILAALGFFTVVALDRLRVPGAIVLTILAVTAAGILAGVSPFAGVVSMPPSPVPTLLQLDIPGALEIGLVAIIFAFFFVDLFDTAGTLVGVAHRAGMLDAQGRMPRLRNALIADSMATIAGAGLGTSTTTSYVESAAGIDAGGRTGLTAVTVAVLFLLALFFAPLAQTVPPYATAPALLFVACMMTRALADIDCRDATEYAPAVVTAVSMPLTFSIATGIGFGFICYAATKLLSGDRGALSPAVIAVAAAFLVKFAIL
jgi:AGZA family xanthine/uracil permease-like MFS transporter